MKLFSVRALLLPSLLLAFTFAAENAAFAQQKKTPDPNRTLQLVRTTVRHEVRRFAYGGTLTLVGAPAGSITIEGWPRNEVDITAEIQLKADTETDLDLLAVVNGFIVDDDPNHIRVLSTGTHDKVYMRTAKKFPKALLGLPWKIDYRIRVPISIDLELSTGRGPISLSDVEGTIRLSAAESETRLKLSGGALSATIAIGKVTLTVPSRGWRRGGADIRMGAGEINLELPAGFNGDVDADILRIGQIDNSYGGLEVREKPGLTPKVVKGRAGAGGALIKLTVADGKIVISNLAAENQ
ncbi:MAG TPA: hypothetical protein VMS31_05175 [Pyrinomonadaceae bacterium]|nr:hypothetical protein [Pyrinomonadaceae bacterium]